MSISATDLQSAESYKSVKLPESAESAKSVKLSESAESSKSAEPAKSAENSRSVKPVCPPALTPSIVQKLCAPIARRLGVKSLYLFGSVAQGTANRNSDVDFIYELQGESNVDCETSRIMRKQELMQSLADCLGRKIDLVNKSYVTQKLADEDAEIQRKAFVTTLNTKPVFQIV
jgi:hypothetical protein